jgi:hypothetical protein
MNRLARIVRSETPSTSVQFRKQTYGRTGVRSFLRDVLAMANAAVEGPRYIVTGAEIDPRGRKLLHGVAREDFSGRPAYQALANEYIEPAVRIRYQPVTIDGERIGVFEIGDCQDRPYMMRVDYSENLRRGDAYARVNEAAVKLGRRQLQELFEVKFQESVSTAAIEVGFPGEIIHKDLRVATCSFAELPSAVASAKLHELIEAKDRVQGSAANTMVARLTHARLFGTDSPYEERSTDEIRQEIAQIERRYRDEDSHFLFEQHATSIQLVIYNQGHEDIHDASITLVMPNPPAFHVATALPKVSRDGRFIERAPHEQSDYPAVTLRDNAIQVSAKLDEIRSGEPLNIFEIPLRICAGTDLKGRRMGIQYSLQAQNLRAAAAGKLRLLFQ